MIQKNFLLLGRFPLERMPSFFAHAGALLVSLKKDPVFSMTIPAKLQTYLMTGIPILGMLDGEGAKIIEESNSGLCCGASDSIGLAAAAKKMSQFTKPQSYMLGQNGIKYSIIASEINREIILDPEISLSLPEKITISTGIDSLCQILESTWSKKANDKSLSAASLGFKYINKNFYSVINNPIDAESRKEMLFASFLSGVSISISSQNAI